MDLVIAAVVLAAGLVAAAIVFARSRQRAGASPAMAELGVALDSREAELVRRDEQCRSLERSLDQRAHDLDRRAVELDGRERNLEREQARVTELAAEHTSALERVSGLSAGQARHALLKEVEDDARHEQARILRQVEDETKRQAERRVRSILSVAMQRLARQSRGRDDRLGRAAPVRRHEGPHHRP